MNEALYYNFKTPSAVEHNQYSSELNFDEIVNTINNYFSNNPNEKLFIENIFDKFTLIELDSNLDSWIFNIETLLFDIKYSYGFLKFYFNEGIPDDKKNIDRNSFNDFEGQHFFNQKSFRIYAEIILIKFFSILDNFGKLIHILNYYNFKKNPELKVLKEKFNHKVYFETAINEINHNTLNKNEILDVKNNKFYKDAKKIRNDISHNKTELKFNPYLKSFISKDSNDKVKGAGMGFEDNYFTSKEVFEIVNELLTKLLPKITKLIFA